MRASAALLLWLWPITSFAAADFAGRCSGLPDRARPAQPAAPDAAASALRAREAERQLRLAAESYRRQDFDVALAALEYAYTLRPSAEVLFNMAQSCREAGAEVEALRLYELSVAQSSDGPLRINAQRRVVELRRKLDRDNELRALAEEQRNLANQQRIILEQQAALDEQRRRDAEQRNVLLTQPAAQAKTPVYKRWWFWTALGGSIVVVAAVGVGMAYALPRQPTYPNVMDVIFP